MHEEKDTPAALPCSNAFYVKFVDIIPYNTHGKPTYVYKEGMREFQNSNKLYDYKVTRKH